MGSAGAIQTLCAPTTGLNRKSNSQTKLRQNSESRCSNLDQFAMLRTYESSLRAEWDVMLFNLEKTSNIPDPERNSWARHLNSTVFWVLAWGKTAQRCHFPGIQLSLFFPRLIRQRAWKNLLLNNNRRICRIPIEWLCNSLFPSGLTSGANGFGFESYVSAKQIHILT